MQQSPVSVFIIGWTDEKITRNGAQELMRLGYSGQRQYQDLNQEPALPLAPNMADAR